MTWEEGREEREWRRMNDRTALGKKREGVKEDEWEGRH